MNEITHKNAGRQSFLLLLREMVRAYQAFEALDRRLHQESGSGLTSAQADILFTLGNTAGMTREEIQACSLLKHGFMEDSIQGMAAAGLVVEPSDKGNGADSRVTLTPKGVETFERVFPSHTQSVGRYFQKLEQSDLIDGSVLFRKVRQALESD